MSASVVVFAIGNPSRGDDAIGPVLIERLADWLDAEGLAEQFELVEDFQLQIEHVLDLTGRQLALFIDAGANTAAPYTFQRCAPSVGIAHTTHELPPEAVLQVYVQTEGTAPPPAFVLCVSGEHFELGEPLTAAAERHVGEAFDFLKRLCLEPSLAVWSRTLLPTERSN
ncbi:MAG: hydrogenase maturation protease [Azonexus sp.]|nr:hydrogenase maturation protease [Azonexus sp.]